MKKLLAVLATVAFTGIAAPASATTAAHKVAHSPAHKAVAHTHAPRATTMTKTTHHAGRTAAAGTAKPARHIAHAKKQPAGPRPAHAMHAKAARLS